MTQEMVFHEQELLEKPHFFVKMTSPAMVRPASSDFWKAPCQCGVKLTQGFSLMRKWTFAVVIITQLLLYSHLLVIAYVIYLKFNVS